MAQDSCLRSAPIRRLRHPLEESPLWGVLGSVLAGILALAVGLPVLLVICILIPFCLLGRWLLLFIFWNRQASGDTQGVVAPESVRGNDGRWLGSAWRYSVIHAVLIFEAGAGLDVTHLRNLLLTRVVPLYPRLTRRPVSLPLSAGAGHCWLPDSQFCIDRHVFAGPDMLNTEKQLQDYVGHLLGEGLSSDKPPWELHVLQRVGRHQDTVAVLRVHQSVADGMALVRVLCHSLADCQVLHVPQRPHFGALAFTLNIFRACIVGPLTLLFWLLLTTEDCNVLTQHKAWSGQVSVTWSAAITLPKVTRIKQVTRSTVNCVLLSALAGAARRLLQSCGVKQPPDMKIVLPVDLRSDITSPRLSSRLGSKMAPVVIGLPVGEQEQFLRLWAMRRNLDYLRTSADPVVVYVATAALMATVPGKIARKLLATLTGKATLQFSSLPGPTSTLLVGGHPLKGIYPLLPAQNSLGLAVSVFTYADQVYVAIISDSALSPAASTLLHHLHCQIELLWQLLLHRRVPGESRSHILLRRTDVTGSPVRELRLRLTCVQEEVQRLSTCQSPNQQQGDQNAESEQQDATRLHNLKIEFSELLSELRRRNSAAVGGNFPMFEDEELGGEMWRPRRRAMSCSSSRRSSRSFVGLLTSARPASFIESYSVRSPANPSSPIIFRPTKSVPGSARPSSYIEPHSSSSSSPLICRAAASECILPGAVGPLSPVDLHTSSNRNSPVLHLVQRSAFCSTNISVISEHPGEIRENQISSVVNESVNSVFSSNDEHDGECVDSEGTYDMVVQSIHDSYHDIHSDRNITQNLAHNTQSTTDCAIQVENLNSPYHSPNKLKDKGITTSPKFIPANINMKNQVHSLPNNSGINTKPSIDSPIRTISQATDDKNLNASTMNPKELQTNFQNNPVQKTLFAESSECFTNKGPIQSPCKKSLMNNSININHSTELNTQDINAQTNTSDATSNQSVIKSLESSNNASEPHNQCQKHHKEKSVLEKTTKSESNTRQYSDNTTNYNAPACVVTLSSSPEQTESNRQTNIPPGMSCSISIPELSCSLSSTSSVLTGEQSIGYEAMESPETSPTLSLVSPKYSFSSLSISSESSGKTFNSSSTFPPSTPSSPSQFEHASNFNSCQESK
ncbi:hypothetical protein L9F63_000766 [Diploptera punctata]|uniref:Diacylglycerol O-acyltransferase n=1 Tax=Diploptera punctata TaxID=6984 RepID=A0AAD8ESU8_DIPPU|nr:hypothetical protein L9F63_000766 [Diploptera punctata]